MTALSSKSAQEISDLLDEYGIKHGPIVDSTRGLYEKKLRAAMSADAPAKPSSDKTYYREEEEEITYVHRRVPLRSEAFVDRTYYSSPANYREPEDDGVDHGSGRSYYTSTTKYREPEDDGGDHAIGRSYYSSTMKYREPEDEGEDQPSLYRSEASRRYAAPLKSTPLRSSSSSATGAAPRKESASGSGRLIPLWLQFLVFLGVAAFLYYVFTSMESPENNPFKGVE